MQNRKVDALQLQAAVAEAQAYLTVAFELLAPFLVVLSDEERIRVPRTRAGLPDAGRNLALAIAEHSAVAQAAAYDPRCGRGVLRQRRPARRARHEARRTRAAHRGQPVGVVGRCLESLSPVFANSKSTKKGTREARAEDIETGIAD
jgi:hypothetical protein